MRFVNTYIRLSGDEYGHARALSRVPREVIGRVHFTNLPTDTDESVRFRSPRKGKMTTPSFILLIVEVIAQLKKRKEAEVAD